MKVSRVNSSGRSLLPAPVEGAGAVSSPPTGVAMGEAAGVVAEGTAGTVALPEGTGALEGTVGTVGEPPDEPPVQRAGPGMLYSMVAA